MEATNQNHWYWYLSILIPLIGTFMFHYIGNKEFRNNINKAFIQIKIKIIKENFFISIYTPFLILTLLLLRKFNQLSLNTILISYTIWITIWIFYIAKKKKNISKIVSCKLGNKQSENGENGLIYIRYEDGDGKREIFQTEKVMRTDISSGQIYLYFTFRDDVQKYFRKAKSVIIIVEYYDPQSDSLKDEAFNIQYDSKDKNHPNIKFKSTNKHNFKLTNIWEIASFQINDGNFQRRQQNKADFRIRCRTRRPKKDFEIIDLYVRKVIAISLNE